MAKFAIGIDIVIVAAKAVRFAVFLRSGWFRWVQHFRMAEFAVGIDIVVPFVEL